MSAPICEVCAKGPADGLTVFRASPKREKPVIWRCRAHLTSEQAEKMPDDLIQIVNMIDPPKPQ